MKGATPGRDTARAQGLPVTSNPRTLLDLACTEDASSLQRLCNEALVRRLLTERQLRELASRTVGRSGNPALRALVSDPAPTRSGGEDVMRAVVRRSSLPTPQSNAKVAGYEVEARDGAGPRPRQVGCLITFARK